MSKHSELEFCELVGIDKKHFTTYLGRNKILVGPDGMIDDKVEPNCSFLSKRRRKMNKAVPDPVKEVKQVQAEKKEKPPKQIPADSYQGTSKGDSAKNMIYTLDQEAKQLSIQKQRVELELAEIKKQKQLGNLLPVPIIKAAFAVHSQSITTEFKHYIDDVLLTISKEYSIDINRQAELKAFLVRGLNIAVDKSVDQSKRKIANIIAEFSESRGVGEHD
jgi:hypothetical protein